MSGSPQSQSPQQQSYDNIQDDHNLEYDQQQQQLLEQQQFEQQQQQQQQQLQFQQYQLQQQQLQQQQQELVDQEQQEFEQNQQDFQNQNDDNHGQTINSRISSPNKRNIFDNLEESPFKNVNKDYGDKYNKVIDRLRESTSLNDLARKYNKIQLPTEIGASNSSNKFVFEASEAKQIMDMNGGSLRMSFEGGFNKQPLQQSQHSNYQTPLKTEGSQISYNQHKKHDSNDFKSSFLSGKNSSAIPNILAQIQQKQKSYKSPNNLAKNNYSQLFENSKNPVSLKYYVSKVNENKSNVLQSPSNLSSDKVQIQEPNSIERSSQRGAKQLRKNFQSFLQDINLGYNGSKTSYNRQVLSPKAFVRKQSPLRASKFSSNNNNNTQNNFQKSKKMVTNQGSLGGLNDLITKIQQKKNTMLQKQEASPIKLQVQGTLGNNGISSSNSNRNLGLSYLGSNYSYHPQHTGKMHQFEQEMDNMRLNSLFSMNKKKSETGTMRLSSIHSKLK